jgi:ABC-type transport system involved in multi-copper enzyme maturation permease subunit
LSAIFTLAIFVIGRLSGDIRLFAEQFAGPGMNLAVFAVYLVVPDLARYQIGSQVIHGLPLTPVEIGRAAAYALAYILMLLFLAVAIFQRRDFK